MQNEPENTQPNASSIATDPAVNQHKRTLPFSKWRPLLAGALAGVALRLLFWGYPDPGPSLSAMMASFIYLVPFVVGMVTVYVAETKKRRTWKYYAWAGFLANVFFVLGTLLIMVEGLICAVIIIPLFAAEGAVGGLVMGAVCRITNWPKQTLYSFAALPLILGMFETNVPLPERLSSIERTITISASPSEVWKQIHNARDIKPDEVKLAWAYRIGVPMPLAGITQQTSTGTVRKITMGKGVHFDQIAAESQENKYVRWTYRFYADSFPPRALDDHVMIGGQYFDFKDTSYTLTPRGNATELTIRMQYRVSTQFNWYADSVAQLLLGNAEEVLLNFYRHRSEAEPRANKIL